MKKELFDIDTIKEIIKAGTPEWITSARKYSKNLQMNINGIGVDKFLSQINGYENDRQYQLRQKFATSNKFVFENLLRPVDKVFSANGGSTVIKTKTETSKKLIDVKLSNVSGGNSIRKFISRIQSNKYYADPSGLVFFEWNKEETYPTIKDINSIRNYEVDGRRVQWVLFEPETRVDNDNKNIKGEFYRFVDSKFDYIIHVVDEKYTILKNETFVNVFGFVPAFTNSDIPDSTLSYHISPVDSVVELANHYLTTTSVKNIYEFLHGYPVFWAYVQPCMRCDGTGLYDGKDCELCGGDGHTFSKDVSDIIKLKPPKDNDEPKIAPDVAGYIQPDLATWEAQRTELDWLLGLMHFSMWGTARQDKVDNETATAAFLDVQPVTDRLNKFSDAFEQTEKLMTDIVGKFYIRDNYEGASVNYGRRFLVEPPETIWNKYEKAKDEGSPKISLDYLLTQFYQSEFKDDLISLVVYQKGIKLEPFIHKTDEQINSLPVMDEDKAKKFYFSEWWKLLNEDVIIAKDIAALNTEFETFIKTKTIKDDGINV